MAKKCPACNSTRVFESKGRFVCQKCNYIHKTIELMETERQEK